MSLIEQAAKRLEELRRAGAALPDDPASPAVADSGAKARQDHVPTPELVRELSIRGTGAATAPVTRAISGDAIAEPRYARSNEAKPKVRVELDGR
jgi:hypothetical protein